MTRLLATAAALALTAGAAGAQDTLDAKIGILVGFTGPIESLAGPMADAAELAIDEVNESGLMTVEAVRGDTTCIDNAAAQTAAERMIADGVNAIVGGDCSGVTGAILQNVAIPNGMVMISPSATSPALSTVDDQDLFFRTAPSDAREGEVMTEVLMDRGVQSVALTYTNNDYGKGLADAFQSSWEAAGGEVTISAAHEDGRADYSAEVGALASAGGDILVVAGYLDQGGLGIIRSALDSGAFDRFVLPGGMVGDSLPENVGPDLDGSYGQIAGSDSEGAGILAEMADDTFDATSAYAPESYDAAAIFMLAMMAAGSTDPADYQSQILNVANAPGEKILPGELARGMQILMDGGEIDYDGATSVELIGPGESAGRYREIEVRDGVIETVGFR